MDRPKPNPTHRLLNVILWLALALRLFALGEQSLWYDEAVTWYLTQFNIPELVRWTAADIQPPFYYVLLWFTSRLFGQSEWALRFPSVCFGVLGIPILWQLGRRLFGQSVGLLTALLLAVAPLMVYYSQEARMYTLLIFQASLGSYLIFRLAQGSTRRPHLVGYVLIMALALYTHYFAGFLVLAHLVYLLTIFWPAAASRRRLLGRQSLLIFGGIGLLFTPWLPVLLARLGDDPSYWPGVLKLPEIVQDVLISFAVGGKREMILEAHGLPLAAGFGLLLLLSLGLLLRHRKCWSNLIFLLLWLVLSIALILLLSYETPKFNPRYTILAWPPFALLLAAGLSQLMSTVSNLPASSWRRYGAALLTGLAAFLILGSWVFSLRNWYFIPEFSRDDFKALAQFVHERSFLDEPILLSSGHAFPVWRYYSQTDKWTPLPQMEALDVNRVTNLDIVPELAAAVQGEPGVWLVSWQDEVIDPNGMVPLLLDMVGERTTDELLIGDFIGVDLQYWHLPETVQFPQNLPAEHATDFNFGGLVLLRGFWQSDNNGDDEVVLFWEALQPLAADYLVSLRLIDAESVAWSDGTQVERPAAYLYPTQRWTSEVVVPGRQALPWLAGTPPGQYWLEIGWLQPDGAGIDVLDANGNPQRRTVQMGPISLSQPAINPDFEAPKPIHDLDGVRLLSASFESTEVEAGSTVLLDTLWNVILGADDKPLAEAVTLTAWQDATGQMVPLEPPFIIDLRAASQTRTILRSRRKLATPYQAEPGLVTLQATIASGDSFPLASLTLQPTDRNFAPPEELDIRFDTGFGGVTTLLGAIIERARLQPGQSTTLTLYWQADGAFEADYTVFVHPLGPAGTPVLNFDHAPPRPTSNWLVGEVIADSVEIVIPSDFAPGTYPVEVGLYNTADPNYTRLPLDSAEGSASDYIILTEIEVVTP